MATFSTLTDKDLSEIGINAWGARRKMLLLIAGMFYHFIIIINILLLFIN